MKVHESHDLSSSTSLSATFTVLAYHWRLRLDEQNHAVFSLFTWQNFKFSEKKIVLWVCVTCFLHTHMEHTLTPGITKVFHIDSFIKLADFGLLHL